MYTKLELSNFRAYKEFSMELKPVTLIAGRNNVGKTTILESIFAFHDYASPDVFSKLLGFRGVRTYDMSAKSIWDPMFNNMNSDEPIEIRLNDRNFLRLAKNKRLTLSKNQLGAFNGNLDASSTNYALSCTFAREKTFFTGDYVLGGDKMNHTPFLFGHENNEIRQNDEPVQYIGPNTGHHDITITEWFGKVELSRNKEKLMEILALIDDDIIDITTIATSRLAVLYFTNKQGVMMPVHTIGDGMRKLLHIALVMLANPGGVLLLDEVENGLHYSVYTSFWKAVSILANRMKCQVVATTHSYECISGALYGIKEAELGEDFADVRLDRNDKGAVIPKTFSHAALERAAETDWEVR